MDARCAGPELDQAVVAAVVAGLDIHVRVVAELPDAKAVDELEVGCGWHEDGHRRARAVLLFVTPDGGDAALWYGADLRPAIGARFATVRHDVLAQTVGQVASSRTAYLMQEIGRLVTSPPAADPLGCDQLVSDPGAQLGADIADVESAAFSLQATGSDVRARVEPAVDGGSIDGRLAQLDRDCPAWQVDGDRAPHLVVVAVSPLSRQTGIWYGAEESDGLSDGWEDIQARDMNPRFKDGDFAGGMAAGLRAIEDLRRPSDQFDPYDLYDPSDDRRGGAYKTTTTSNGNGNGGEAILLVLLAFGLMGAGVAISYFSWKAKYDSGETDLSFSEYNRQNRRRGGGRYFGGGGGGFSSGGFSGGGGGSSSSGGGGHSSGGGSSSW